MTLLDRVTHDEQSKEVERAKTVLLAS